MYAVQYRVVVHTSSSEMYLAGTEQDFFATKFLFRVEGDVRWGNHSVLVCGLNVLKCIAKSRTLSRNSLNAKFI